MTRQIFIAGAKGWGKSTLARELTGRDKRRIVLDPSGDWERSGLAGTSRLSVVSETIARNWQRGFAIVYRAPVGSENVELARLAMLLHAYLVERGLYRRRASDELTVIVDEMADAYSTADQQSRACRWTRKMVAQGRHWGVSLVGISQRPQDVSAQFRDLSDEYYAFALHSDTGQRAVIDAMGRANGAAYLSLGKHEYLAKRAGVVSRGKTRKS